MWNYSLQGNFHCQSWDAFLNFLLDMERKKIKSLLYPTRVLSIYFKDVPSRVIGLEPGGIFSELIWKVSDWTNTQLKYPIPLLALDRSDLWAVGGKEKIRGDEKEEEFRNCKKSLLTNVLYVWAVYWLAESRAGCLLHASQPETVDRLGAKPITKIGLHTHHHHHHHHKLLGNF